MAKKKEKKLDLDHYHFEFDRTDYDVIGCERCKEVRDVKSNPEKFIMELMDKVSHLEFELTMLQRSHQELESELRDVKWEMRNINE
jgi:hypothetical protein